MFFACHLRLQHIALWVLLLAMSYSNAQIKNIPIGKEVKIENLYAGLLSYTSLSSENSLGKTSSIQLGVRARFELLPNTFSFRTFGVFKSSEGQGLQFFKSFESILNINKTTTLHFGLMATPATKLRPNPTTWESQVETNAERTILGGRKGIKINHQINSELQATYGFHKHKNAYAHHLRVAYKQLSVVTYVEKRQLFTAMKWNYNKGGLVFTRFDQNTSLSSIVPISINYRFYADIEYNGHQKSLTYLELEIRRHFSEKHLIKGFVSLSYNYDLKGFEGGLFIHI